MSLRPLEKQPSESRVYTMDFSPNMAEGETISSITSVTPTPLLPAPALTITEQTIVGQTVTIRIAGGTAGYTYKVTFVVVTSGPQTLEGDGLLAVRAV